MSKTIYFPTVLLLLFFLNEAACYGVNDSTQVNKKRLRTVLVGTGVAYGAGLVALNEVWYKEQGKTDFHFFNDNSQWNQVDKIGHFYTAYQLSSIGKRVFLWTNMDEKKSAIWGSVMSQALMIPIEIMDGFAVEYGFSWGDIAANLLGSGFFLSQELGWKGQKIKAKFSFHRTTYAKIRPDVLGNGFFEELLKDYNGQTYWLSFDIYKLARRNNSLPKWLNIAVGYGANGMVYAREDENRENGYESYRQYYVGIDFDLSHIHTKSKFLNSVLFFADMVKLPAPTVEFNKNGVHYHWLYF
ncbi:MAG: YfiM family protein [Cytophagales bacterium]|nr:YfiM family protein [Cytophagales bacterium]